MYERITHRPQTGLPDSGKHYHVRFKGEYYNYPEVISPYLETAMNEFVNQALIIYEMFGNEIVKTYPQQVIFCDNGTLEWFECCDHTCYVAPGPNILFIEVLQKGEIR